MTSESSISSVNNNVFELNTSLKMYNVKEAHAHISKEHLLFTAAIMNIDKSENPTYLQSGLQQVLNIANELCIE